MKLLQSFAFCLGFLSSVGADCQHNNVLRALIRHSTEAYPFCKSYIATTVQQTIKPTMTLTITSQILSTTVVSTFTSVFSTATTTTFLTLVTSSTSVPLKKRTTQFLSIVPLPSYVSQYSPSEVQSGCSCLTIDGATFISISTAPTQTTVKTTTITVPNPVTSIISTTSTTTILATSIKTVSPCPTLLQNGGFDTDTLDPWTLQMPQGTGHVEMSSTGCRSGPGCALYYAGNTILQSNTWTTTPGHIYIISAWAQVLQFSQNQFCSISIEVYHGTSLFDTFACQVDPVVDGQFHQCSGTATAVSTGMFIWVYVSCGYDGGTVIVDDVSVLDMNCP
jgi:hypothetical protein